MGAEWWNDRDRALSNCLQNAFNTPFQSAFKFKVPSKYDRRSSSSGYPVRIPSEGRTDPKPVYYLAMPQKIKVFAKKYL
jgi:hypothetical protein